MDGKRHLECEQLWSVQCRNVLLQELQRLAADMEDSACSYDWPCRAGGLQRNIRPSGVVPQGKPAILIFFLKEGNVLSEYNGDIRPF